VKPSGFDYLNPKKEKKNPKPLLYMKVAKPGTNYRPQKLSFYPPLQQFSFELELPTSLPCSDNINYQLTTTSKR
jgi:hypothetical protein